MSYCETHQIEIPDEPDELGRRWECGWCMNDRWKAGIPLYPPGGEYVIYPRDNGRLACIEPYRKAHLEIDEKDMAAKIVVVTSANRR